MAELFSNAPSDWPSIRLSGIAPENWCDALAQTLSEAGLIVLDSQVPRLLSSGVLEVPLRVRDADNVYDVFFYPQADEAAAAHFLAVLELAWNNTHLRPLFFSLSKPTRFSEDSSKGRQPQFAFIGIRIKATIGCMVLLNRLEQIKRPLHKTNKPFSSS